MLTLDECATRLAYNFNERAKLNLRVWRAGQAIEARATELRPEAGWPGKNDEARAAAKEAALAADQSWQNAAADLEAAKAEMIGIEADIAGVEAERRALEWRIRERLVEVLTRQGYDSQSRGDRAEAGFDDALQHEIDPQPNRPLAAELSAGLEPGPGADGIEYPF